MIRITCPECSSPLSAPDEKAGLRGNCPTCGTKVKLPSRMVRFGNGSEPPVQESPDHQHSDHDRLEKGKRHAFWTLRRLLAGLAAIALLIAVIVYLLREPRGGAAPTVRPPGQPKLFPGFSYTDFSKSREWAKGVIYGVISDQLQFSGNGIRQREIWQSYRDAWREHVGKRVTWEMPVALVTDTDVFVTNWYTFTKQEVKEARGGADSYLQVLFLPLGKTELTPYQGQPPSSYHYQWKSMKIGPQISARTARNLTSNGPVTVEAEIHDMEFFGQLTVFIILKDAKTPR